MWAPSRPARSRRSSGAWGRGRGQEAGLRWRARERGQEEEVASPAGRRDSRVGAAAAAELRQEGCATQGRTSAADAAASAAAAGAGAGAGGQLVDIKIAGYRHNQSGRANISGFVAMRDTVEPLRNYVYRREVNNCEAISVNRKTGVARLSLTSPARVISMVTRVLIEFELYVRTDALPEDKPKGECLIEGCTEFTNFHESKSFVEHRRMYGERCALDVKYMMLINAVEARVELKVLRLGAIAGGVNMKLLAKTSGFDEVIRLFRGAAPEPHSMMTFVVASERRNNLDLYIEAAPRDDPFVGKKSMSCSWQECSFRPGFRGTDEEEVKLGEFAELSLKDTLDLHADKTNASALIARMHASRFVESASVLMLENG
ncbi:uncharacterized protein C2845_PM05G13930 [Panicum miliaceum]|uniref:DUF6598 domain-containing protein n=1 Tax=Panicum miliaceum TaxID=4540 RepID=A0A3L6SVL3_PANMI|nr:uncharacterized protein C2845_PM05G13930 [Panicum miliaceum]